MTSTHSQPERNVRSRMWVLALVVLGLVIRFGPVSFSAAMFTNSSQNSASVGSAVDWTAPMVDIIDPGDAIRGTVTITIDASDAETGINNVVLSWAPTGTTTWTNICTDSSSPYTCNFVTTGIADQDIDLRAVATDNSNYTATDIIEGITVDNATPTVSLNTIASPMAGVVNITATATDAGSGVANVIIQRSLAGLNSWTTLCTATVSPYTCRFDTTTVSDGLYDFRAIATDYAGNSKISTTVANRAISNINSSVSVDDPGAYIRGTVTITANANAATGVQSVKIQRAPYGSSTWTDLCTDTTSPYSCPFVTTSVADGQYQFRAILTDNLGLTTTSATVGPNQVDNTTTRGYDVQAVNNATVGKLAATDVLTLTYSTTMNLTTILSGWTGTSTAVVLRAQDGAKLGLTNIDDTLDVFTSTNLNTPVNLGSVDLKGNFIRGNKVTLFNGTMVASTVTVNGVSATQITITLGTVASGANNLRTAASTPVSMLWSPSATAKSLAGVASSAAVTTELGTLDRDF